MNGGSKKSGYCRRYETIIFHSKTNTTFLTKGNKGEYKRLPAVGTDGTSSVEQLVGSGATIAHGKKILCSMEGRGMEWKVWGGAE